MSKVARRLLAALTLLFALIAFVEAAYAQSTGGPVAGRPVIVLGARLTF